MNAKASSLVAGIALVGLAMFTFVACSNSEEAAPSRTIIPAGTSSGDTGTSGTSGTGVGDGGSDAAPDELATCGAVEGCTCTPFDNAGRLGLYKAGQALPAIP